MVVPLLLLCHNSISWWPNWYHSAVKAKTVNRLKYKKTELPSCIDDKPSYQRRCMDNPSYVEKTGLLVCKYKLDGVTVLLISNC